MPLSRACDDSHGPTLLPCPPRGPLAPRLRRPLREEEREPGPDDRSGSAEMLGLAVGFDYDVGAVAAGTDPIDHGREALPGR